MNRRLLPDSAIAEAFIASPNHNERRGFGRPDCVILHYTGMPTGAEALAWLCNPASEVSSHYFVWEDGRVVRVPVGERPPLRSRERCQPGASLAVERGTR